MTCILAGIEDGIAHMAADTRVSDDSTTLQVPNTSLIKIHKTETCLIGYCGNISEAQIALQYYSSVRGNPKCPDELLDGRLLKGMKIWVEDRMLPTSSNSEGDNEGYSLLFSFPKTIRDEAALILLDNDACTFSFNHYVIIGSGSKIAYGALGAFSMSPEFAALSFKDRAFKCLDIVSSLDNSVAAPYHHLSM